MNTEERKITGIYLIIITVMIFLCRLYWIFGDDPIGLLVVFLFVVPVLSFWFASMLGNARLFWLFPFIAGAGNALNYILNSSWSVKLVPDTGTIAMFAIACAAGFAGVLFRRIYHLFNR